MCFQPPKQNETITVEDSVYKKQFQLTNVDARRPNYNDPSVWLPDKSGSYLDYSFNSQVPIELPNGEIVNVKMCVPTVQSISNTGIVTVVFSKSIIPVVPQLYKQIMLSGVI